MTGRGITGEDQLTRQLTWLKDPWLWLMRNKVIEHLDAKKGKPTALDVGCGPGLVMDLFSSTFEVQGIDIDPEMVRSAKERGLKVFQGDAHALPFEDGSFDVAYCSFTLLWVEDQQKAIEEMARVSKRYVVSLAEPDYGGRICHPKEVADLDRFLVESLIDEGADPFTGRKLGRIMEEAGLEVETGAHSGVMSPFQLRKEAKAEWDSLAKAVGPMVDDDVMARAKEAWDRALIDRSLFLFNPVFYAIGRK